MTAEQENTSGPAADAELREDIERTREQLGETVEALAAKTDVKARARKKVSQAKEQATARAAAAQEQAAARIDLARVQVADKAATAKQKALSASRPTAEHVQGSAEVAGADGLGWCAGERW